MRISDWSSDVCSSDLLLPRHVDTAEALAARLRLSRSQRARLVSLAERGPADLAAPRALAYVEGLANATDRVLLQQGDLAPLTGWEVPQLPLKGGQRSDENTSEIQH